MLANPRLNFYTQNTLLLVLCGYYTQLLGHPFTGESWFYDFTARLHLNETYLHLSHFYWTTLTYLGPFFLFQVTIVLFYFKPRYFWALICLYLFYITELNDFLVSNYWLGLSTLGDWDFNNLLTNHLNKYHPHIFYLSTIWCISIPTLNSTYLSQWRRSSSMTYLNHTLVRVLYLSGSINVFALFLGSWWAFQEGTWGGWWNWDPSEVLGLLILTLSLLGTHHFSTNSQLFKLTVKLQIGVILFILTYFFTQLNFDLVSHNFGNRFTFFFTNTLFYLESATLTLLTSIILFSLTLSRSLQKQNFRIVKGVNYQPIILFIMTSCIGLWLILTSFIPLGNYFLWQYFHLNIFNIVVSHQLLLLYLTLTLYTLFSTHCVNSTLTTIFVLGVQLPTSLISPLLVNYRSSSTILTLHTLLLTQLILNVLLNQLDVIINSANLLSTTPLHLEVTINVCEDVWRESFYLQHSDHVTPHLSSTFSTKSNISEVNPFLLIQDCNNFTNLYQISSYYLRITVEILTPYFSNLYESVLLTVMVFTLWSTSVRTIST